MIYAIFVLSVIFILYLYHRIIYHFNLYSGKYEKFEYYLIGECNESIANLMIASDIFIILSAIVIGIYLGGKLFTFCFNLFTI